MNCLNCGAKLSNRKDAKYCSRRECQQASWRARPKRQKVCRCCGDDITGKLGFWCSKTECQEHKYRGHLARIRELQQCRKGTGYQKHHDWIRTLESRKPPRFCRRCGKEIYLIKDGDGVVIFDGYFHCSSCSEEWNRQADGVNEECIHMGQESVL